MRRSDQELSAMAAKTVKTRRKTLPAKPPTTSRAVIVATNPKPIGDQLGDIAALLLRRADEIAVTQPSEASVRTAMRGALRSRGQLVSSEKPAEGVRAYRRMQPFGVVLSVGEVQA